MSSATLEEVQQRTDLPGHLDLPESDGQPMPNMHQPLQTALLNQSLVPRLNEIHPDRQYCVAGDCFIYYSHTQPPLDGCKGPDWFYIPGVSPMLNDDVRRSYVLWRELVRPRVVVEYVSGDGSEERDRTPPKGKHWVYERLIGADFYVVFDYLRDILEVNHLVNGVYQPMTPNANGRFPIAPLDVELGLWHGTFCEVHSCWLRAWDCATGQLLPTADERTAAEALRADEEALRADEEALRADQAEAGLEETQTLLTEQIDVTKAERRRADALAARLRELGINPDEIAGS